MNNNLSKLYIANYRSGIGLIDLKIIDKPINQDIFKEKSLFQTYTLKSIMKPLDNESGFRELPTSYNDNENCFEAKKVTKRPIDSIEKTGNDNSNNDIVELIKNITENNKSIENQMMALMKLITDVVIDKKSFSKSDDEDECKESVWKTICEFQTEIFRKVRITSRLQKRFDATQIDQALKKLCSEGLISKLKDDRVTKREDGKPGRPKSPIYKVNNFGQDINFISEK